MNFYSNPPTAAAEAERRTATPFPNLASSCSPDRQTIASLESNPETGQDIWTVNLGDRRVRPFLKTQSNETAPKFSTDGHWLAYTSDESGRWEVYVQPYPGPGGKWQISTEGGTEPVWNPGVVNCSGREPWLMAVPIALQPVSAGKPVVLFEGPWLPTR
jgi:Tol biopolymer transport system component